MKKINEVDFNLSQHLCFQQDAKFHLNAFSLQFLLYTYWSSFTKFRRRRVKKSASELLVLRVWLVNNLKEDAPPPFRYPPGPSPPLPVYLYIHMYKISFILRGSINQESSQRITDKWGYCVTGPAAGNNLMTFYRRHKDGKQMWH